ncbi:MAG: DUF2237 family protein [Hyphomonas sp.]
MTPLNVLGAPLADCSHDPLTGYFRNGCCETGPMDLGSHTVCAVLTADFLQFSYTRGNDLITPRPGLAFAGLRPGDRWCLCVNRWREAWEAGCAPPVLLEATHAAALRSVTIEMLMAHRAPHRQEAP